MYFVVVALSEEGFKYLAMRWRTWRSPEFNCRFDGVVYAVFVSLGFALAENIGYVLMYGLGAALMRAITAVPGHASFGVFMGAYYGLARRSENLGRHGLSVFWRVLALLIPTLIHGMYDFIAVTDTETISSTFVVFVLIVFALAFVLVKQLSKRDRYIDY
jgi:RsiW-degrading membrane proteinase PrsW (M82 family)